MCRLLDASTRARRDRWTTGTCTLHGARSSELQDGQVRYSMMDQTTRRGLKERDVPIAMFPLASTFRLGNRECIAPNLASAPPGIELSVKPYFQRMTCTCHPTHNPVNVPTRVLSPPIPRSGPGSLPTCIMSSSGVGLRKAGRASVDGPLAQCDSCHGRIDSSPVGRKAAGSRRSSL